MTALLGLQAVVFAIWTFLMFRTLFRLRARAVRRSGRMFPGVIDTLEGYRALVLLPEYRSDRRLLLAATLTLFALILLGVWLREG